jgi:DNA-directed RNA polymerase specialized sigma subunit
MATKAPKRAKNDNATTTTSKYYLNNAQLLPEVIKSKEQGKISNELARMLMKLTQRYATSPAFNGYSYRDDMVSEAMVDLCKSALKFNPEKSDNPFAFYTTCITNSFFGFLNKEKKHRKIRDQLLIDIGENPSFNFQQEYQEANNSEGFVKEFRELSQDIGEARERRLKEDLAAKALEDIDPIDKLLTFDDPTTTTTEIIFTPYELQYTKDNQESSDDDRHSPWSEGEFENP